jgi:hypothetical protein
VVDGLELRRVGEDRSGILWQVTRVSNPHETRKTRTARCAPRTPRRNSQRITQT